MAEFRVDSHTIKRDSVLHFYCLLPFERSNIVLPLKMSGGLNVGEKLLKNSFKMLTKS